MVSKLLSIWRPLSLLFFAVGAILIWQSLPKFQEAAAAAQPVTAMKALDATGTVALDDTLIFDLSKAGLGQDNVMGIKGKEYAIVQAHPAGDTTRTLLLLTSNPTYLGPVVNSFLLRQSASLDDHNLTVKSTQEDGNEKLQARAMIQQLAVALKANLEDSILRREPVRGTGKLRPAADFPQFELQGEILAIREGYMPAMEQALLFALGGGLLILGNGALWLWDRRRRNEQDELDAAEPPEAPLV